jgi:YebC/PmpR family DNA-binding regulatory protein
MAEFDRLWTGAEIQTRAAIQTPSNSTTRQIPKLWQPSKIQKRFAQPALLDGLSPRKRSGKLQDGADDSKLHELKVIDEKTAMGRSFEVRKVSMAKTAGQKSKIYSKYGKQLYVLAKNSGADPAGNPSLRSLIEKAKKDQVPAHVIEKALEKASGVGGEDFVSARYEGFGPGGCSVIVDCLTDNNNRTITDVRNCFTKTSAKMGAPGSVAHLFDHLAILSFKGQSEEAVLEALLAAEVDVSDVEVEDDQVTVFAPPTEFFKAKQALQEAFPGVVLEVEEITFVPQTRAEISAEDLPMFEKFMNMLNDCDDVQDVYHNATLPG